MTREEVLAVVLKNLKDVIPDLNPAELDLNKNYSDYDINSLDLVQIITATMRELQVKIPINELANVKCTNALVDTLHKVINA